MSEKLTKSLKQLNLKVTPKRIAIIEILMKEPGYLSPEEIWRKMKRQFNRIGLPTVYRNLEELADGNIISKITHPNRQLYYFFCGNNEHHHHFVCLSCRNVDDINFCAIHELQKEVKKKLNAQVVSHILQVNGLCKECLRKRVKEDLA
ncbi:MAG TPA: Fur family transcriptional regulator [Thermodesulfovibrionales bacterium]|jgi:Fur family ferric uptake transcriptional regulator|nr:Fur family transcriptional regulator [Thermodesulfovibrionales bacterium]